MKTWHHQIQTVYIHPLVCSGLDRYGQPTAGLLRLHASPLTRGSLPYAGIATCIKLLKSLKLRLKALCAGTSWALRCCLQSSCLA